MIADEQPAMYQVLQAAGMTHGKGMQSYLCMMAVRLQQMKRVLKDTGSIYLHCDPTASHYLKLVMDAIYGTRNFRNEIIWAYRGGGSPKKDFGRRHDVILRYSVTNDYRFVPDAVRIPYQAEGIGRTDDAMWGRHKGSDKVYKPHALGKVPEDWWPINVLNANDPERMGYPTQKPLVLLERIIKASSNEGDIVLDPFCGCATACVAAENLDRHWIGIDISPKAVELVNMRLQQSMGDLFHNRLVTARTDVPRRTDIDAPVPYRQNKHVLFGQQEGRCNGCRSAFEFRNFTIDHIIPEHRGGTDHVENLQLLCGHCNSVPYRQNKHVLFGQQEGRCNGWFRS